MDDDRHPSDPAPDGGPPGDMDELAWTTLDSDVAYSCPGFEIVSQTVSLPDGSQTDFDYLTEPPAVVILPFTPGGDVVVIDEWRQAVGRVNRGIPAGTVESVDEDRSTAARRELREETGYEANTIESLVTVEPANGLADSVHQYFVARDCTPSSDQQLDHDESIDVATTSLDALRQAVTEGQIRDGRLVTALSYWFLTQDLAE